MKEKFAKIISILIVLAMLGACAQPAAAPTEAPAAPAATEAPAAAEPVATEAPAAAPAEEKILKLGLVAPYTGPNARVGEEFKYIHEMAFGAKDWKIGDYKVVPIYIDDESDPEKAVRAFKDAVLKENIVAATAGYHSSVTLALMDVLAQYKIPYFFPQNESGAIVEKWKSDPVKYAYHSWKGRPNPTKLVVGYDYSLFQEAIDAGIWAPANKTAAIICDDNDFGRSMCAGFKDLVIAKGWELVGEDYVPLDATDLYPLLTKTKQAEPDLLFVSMSVPAIASGLIKQVREVGIDSLFISHGLGWIGEWYDLTGEFGDYVLDMMQKFRTDEQIAYRDAFQAKFNITPSASLSVSYDYDNFFIKICERALELYGELTSETIFKVGNEEVSQGLLTFTEGLWYGELKWTPETLPEMMVGEGYSPRSSCPIFWW